MTRLIKNNFLALLLITMIMSCTSKGIIPLKIGENLEPINVNLNEVKHGGKNAIHLKSKVNGQKSIVRISDKIFANGVIELDVAAQRSEDAHPMSRGFVGLAFNISEDNESFDCFYLRAANGRATDQLQRNHTVQYISVPGNEWHKLREESPGKYESYVDMVPGAWTHVKIEIKDGSARLFVHGASQPTLIVNELLGQNKSGGIALWLAGGTDAYYANLKIVRDED